MTQRHWLKFDHITFLLMLPAIVGGLIISYDFSFYFFNMILALWIMAFVYDYFEHRNELGHQGD